MCRGGLPPSSADGATVFGRAALVAGGAGEVAVGGGGRGALLWQKRKWGWGFPGTVGFGGLFLREGHLCLFT